MKKYLFIDRDGTLIKEPSDFQVDSLEKVAFLDNVFIILNKLKILVLFLLCYKSRRAS